MRIIHPNGSSTQRGTAVFSRASSSPSAMFARQQNHILPESHRHLLMLCTDDYLHPNCLNFHCHFFSILKVQHLVFASVLECLAASIFCGGALAQIFHGGVAISPVLNRDAKVRHCLCGARMFPKKIHFSPKIFPRRVTVVTVLQLLQLKTG